MTRATGTFQVGSRCRPARLHRRTQGTTTWALNAKTHRPHLILSRSPEPRSAVPLLTSLAPVDGDYKDTQPSQSSFTGMRHLSGRIWSHGIPCRYSSLLGRSRHQTSNMDSSFSTQPVGRFARESEAVRRPKACTRSILPKDLQELALMPCTGVCMFLIRR